MTGLAGLKKGTLYTSGFLLCRYKYHLCFYGTEIVWSRKDISTKIFMLPKLVLGYVAVIL